MALFTALYANCISKGTKDIPVYRLAQWVYNLDLDTYIDSIGIDPLLRHEQVRELAALQALHESYYNFKYYDPSMVVKEHTTVVPPSRLQRGNAFLASRR